VDTYQCEWKTAIESEEKRAKFMPFINSDQQSTDLGYQRIRGQRIPVTIVDPQLED
jgi:nitrite reductase (NADH) large subunit